MVKDTPLLKGKKSVNFNDKGEVVSVTLKDSKGRNRTFRGDVAQEITFYFSEPQTTNEDTRSIDEIVIDNVEEENGGRLKLLLKKLRRRPKSLRQLKSLFKKHLKKLCLPRHCLLLLGLSYLKMVLPKELQRQQINNSRLTRITLGRM